MCPPERSADAAFRRTVSRCTGRTGCGIYFEHVAEIMRTDSTCSSCCPEAVAPADGLLLRVDELELPDELSSLPMIST
jgi:hypothetical protein